MSRKASVLPPLGERSELGTPVTFAADVAPFPVPSGVRGKVVGVEYEPYNDGRFKRTISYVHEGGNRLTTDLVAWAPPGETAWALGRGYAAARAFVGLPLVRKAEFVAWLLVRAVYGFVDLLIAKGLFFFIRYWLICLLNGVAVVMLIVAFVVASDAAYDSLCRMPQQAYEKHAAAMETCSAFECPRHELPDICLQPEPDIFALSPENCRLLNNMLIQVQNNFAAENNVPKLWAWLVTGWTTLSSFLHIPPWIATPAYWLFFAFCWVVSATLWVVGLVLGLILSAVAWACRLVHSLAVLVGAGESGPVRFGGRIYATGQHVVASFNASVSHIGATIQDFSVRQVVSDLVSGRVYNYVAAVGQWVEQGPDWDPVPWEVHAKAD